MKQISLSAKVENLDAALDFIEAELELHDCPMKTALRVRVAAEEIFVNIASYAYAPAAGDATITVDVQGGMAAITFIDSGVAYNPLARADPDVTLAAEERGIGGLGIHMVKKSMDDVKYVRENGENRLTLFKKL